MDSTVSFDPHAADGTGAAHAVLAEVTCRWLEHEPITAVILHAAKDMLVLEAADPRLTLPPLGTVMQVNGEALKVSSRLAEYGRAGRFLVCMGGRPVRRAVSIRVSFLGPLRCPLLPDPLRVVIGDPPTVGSRRRGA